MKSLKSSISSILAAAVIFTSLPVFSVPVWADTTIKNEDGSTTTVTTDANGNNVETTTNSEGQVISRRTTYNDNPNNYIPAGTASTSASNSDATTGTAGFTQAGTHQINYNNGSLSTLQVNKEATSSIRAKTMGYRFTNETTGKTMVISMDDVRVSTSTTKTTDPSTGYTLLNIVSNFASSLTNQIFNTIGNPLAGGQLVRMDHIMAVTTDGGEHYSGSLKPDGTFQYNQEFINTSPYAARVMKMSADGLFDKNELTALQKVFGWAHPESWETNYEKYLYLKDGV